MKPSVFIGSSREALKIAQAVRKELSKEFHADLWRDGIFELGEDVLDELLRFVKSYEFAVFILSEDDFTESRKGRSKSPRDNVILELGLFLGALGRRRAFAVLVPGKRTLPKMPTDLLGNI